MHITIDEQDARPVYRQVADGIKALIARGELREGVQLPPVRQIAADLGVNLNTIAVAYRELAAEGLLEIRHGAGATVLSRLASEKTAEELRRPLRQALTGLVLAGWTRAEITGLVGEELRGLLKGGR